MKDGIKKFEKSRRSCVWRHIVELPAAGKMCGIISPPKKDFKETIKEILRKKLLCPFTFTCIFVGS